MKTKRSLIVLLLVSLLPLTLIIGFSINQLSKCRTFQVFGELTNRVNTGEKVVALTFDDGPSSVINEVLDILVEKDVKATFMLLAKI